MGTFTQISILKLLIVINISSKRHLIQNTVENPSFIIRLCSFHQEFEGHKINLRSWLVKRRYLEEIIDKEMSKVKFNFFKKINLKEKEEKGVPLVVTYHLIALTRLLETIYIYCI